MAPTPVALAERGVGNAQLSGQGSDGLDAGQLLDALPRAVIVTDPGGHVLMWNRRAEELYGWASDEVLGRLVSEVLVPVDERHRAREMVKVVWGGETWEGDFTVLHRDGRPVRIWVTGQPIFDESGSTIAILGASEDVSHQRLLEQRAADLNERLRLALDAGGLGTFRWDKLSGLGEWDARTQALFGLAPGVFSGTFEAWLERVHPDERDRFRRMVQEAAESETSCTVEYRVVWPDGTEHWLQSWAQAAVNQDGTAGTIGCTRDITERAVAELERQEVTIEALGAAEEERVHRQRLEFLARVTDVVGSARDHRELMANVARAAVPRLGDWCTLYVLADPRSRVPDVEVAYADPAMAVYARELQDKFPYDPDAPGGMAQVIRTGRAEFYPTIDEAVVDNLGAPEEVRDIVRRLGLASSIAVPLVKRGRVLGGLQLAMARTNRAYTDDDLILVQAVASRVASSLEYMRLSGEQRAIAVTLQASLLPRELPAIPGVDTAVRYSAAGENIQVGGDFYDLFELGEDHWAVVIGDVCGKGPEAAALTALVRHSVAGAAWHGDDHERVLRNLNRTMLVRAPEACCTVLYGTLRKTPDGFIFTFSSGGHPLPVLAHADGSAISPGVYGTLIGAFDSIDLTTTTVPLHPGDALVLYTDGATDLAPPNDMTSDDLAALVGRAASGTATAEQLAERLETDLSVALPMAERDDDVAILVLRVPRPS